MKITSPAFGYNEQIPDKYTCKGENVNPPLEISEIPENSESLAMVMDDPDAPMGNFMHWMAGNISPNTKEIAENQSPAEAIELDNDAGSSGYYGPCPPSGTHRYFFRAYALDNKPEISSEMPKDEFLKIINQHKIEEAELMGLYAKD